MPPDEQNTAVGIEQERHVGPAARMSLPWEGEMIELLERQKRLTANQWKLICTANVADLLDFFDFFLIGYVTAALTKEWSLPYWQGGAILLASGLGAVPGAFVVGRSCAIPKSFSCPPLCRRPDRHDADGRRVVWALGRDAAGGRVEHKPCECRVPDDILQPCRHPRPL